MAGIERGFLGLGSDLGASSLVPAVDIYDPSNFEVLKGLNLARLPVAERQALLERGVFPASLHTVVEQVRQAPDLSANSGNYDIELT